MERRIKENNEMDAKIENVRCIVVGGAGFLGSHLVNHLIDDRNCEVLVLDNLSVGKMERVHPKATFEWCDITGSENTLRKIIENYKCDY